MGLTLVAFPAVVCAQITEVGEVSVQATPEIKKLFEAFARDWHTSENREQTQFFPNGGERKGRSHIHLGAGGRAADGRPLTTAQPDRQATLSWSGGIRTQAFTASSASKIREAAVKLAARPKTMVRWN